MWLDAAPSQPHSIVVLKERGTFGLTIVGGAGLDVAPTISGVSAAQQLVNMHALAATSLPSLPPFSLSPLFTFFLLLSLSPPPLFLSFFPNEINA